MKIIIAAIILAISIPVFAGEKHKEHHKNSIDKRLVNEEKRIEQGIKTGQLTVDEAARLKAEQAGIAGLEAIARANGKVEKAERKEIKTLQNMFSKEIYNEKHDKDRYAKGKHGKKHDSN